MPVDEIHLSTCCEVRKNAAVRAGCEAADVHLRCTYPDCGCKDFPKGVEAAILAWANHNDSKEK
jgi:hypothetical protein